MVVLFQLQKTLFKLMGHNMETDKSGLKLEFQHFATLFLIASANYPMSYYVYYNIDDMELITASLSVMFTNMLTVIKIVTFLIHKRSFWQMMNDYSKMYKQFILGSNNALIIDANKQATRLSQAYYLSCGCTGFYFMLGPVLKIIRSKILGIELVRELPMPMRFPFDYVQTPGYECCFVYTAFVTFTVVSYASAIDGLYISFALNVRAHFKALQHYICSIDFDKVNLKSLEQDIINVVDYHIVLLQLAKNLCTVYTPIIFGQFLITSLQVCVIIYQAVTHMNSIMGLLVYLTFFAAIMLQLFIYCYGGEIIKNESLMVGVVLQLTDWYKLLPEYRRMLQFIMLRAQRETLIKVIFYEASLANFTSIIRAALSYITLLQSIDKTHYTP